jgi:hypothetical protein
MGTKNSPGPHSCYEKAEPDEPLFTLLARDEDAPKLVELWAEMRLARRPEDTAQAAEARQVAAAMRAWRARARSL